MDVGGGVDCGVCVEAVWGIAMLNREDYRKFVNPAWPMGADTAGIRTASLVVTYSVDGGINGFPERYR